MKKKIGVGQAAFKIGKADENREIITGLLQDADEQDVDVLVLPELANSGYALRDRDEALSLAEEIPAGPTSQYLQAWSKADRMVVCGICEIADGIIFNSAAVFAGGKWLGTYRKAHLFMREAEIFSPGRALLPIIRFGSAKFGVLICYDWAFPEMSRALAMAGAQVLLHPANLVLPYGQDAMVVRGIENHVFTATANRFGLERGLAFSGASQITSPKGEVLAKAGREERGIFTAELDPAIAEDKMITAYNHVFNDRRVELYGQNLKGESKIDENDDSEVPDERL